MGKIEEELGLSEDQAFEKLQRLGELERKNRITEVDERIKSWQTGALKEQPALLKKARDIMLSDDGHTALLLSEHNENGESTQEKGAKRTATEIVEDLMEAFDAKPAVNLSEQHAFRPNDTRPGEEKPVKERADKALAELGMS